MKSTRSLILLSATALISFACGGRYLGEYEDYGVGDGDGDGDIYAGDGDAYPGDGDGYPGDGDTYPGDGDLYPGDGDIYLGDGDGYPGDGDTYPGDGDLYPGDGDITIDPPDADPTAPLGSCQNPLALTTSGARGDAGSGWNRFYGPCPGDGDEMVYQFVAPETGVYAFDTRGSGFDTTLHLTTESCGGQVIECNDDHYDLQSLVSTQLQAGQVVYLILQAYDWNVGDFIINVTYYEPYEPSGCPDTNLGSDLGAPLLVEELPLPPDREFVETNACGGGPALVNYAWTAPTSANYVFSTSGSNFDTVLTLRETCGGPMLTCNDDSYSTSSRLAMFVEQGQPMVVEIAAYGNYFYFDENPDFGGPTVVLSIWED